MKSVYIFRGSPAAGKGTLVPEFCQLLPKPVGLIEQDALRWGFHLIGRTVEEISDAEHSFANSNMVLLYEQYLKNSNYTIVLEGLFTWDDASSSQGNAKQLLDMAQAHVYDAKSIVLKANKEELLRRNERREYSVPPVKFEKLYEHIYRIIDSSEIVVDSSGQTALETFTVLKRIINT